MRSNYLDIIFGSLFGKFKCVIKTTGLVYLQNCSITCLYSCRSLQDFSICYQQIISCYQNIWKFFGQNSHVVECLFVNSILSIRKFVFFYYIRRKFDLLFWGVLKTSPVVNVFLFFFVPLCRRSKVYTQRNFFS